MKEEHERARDSIKVSMKCSQLKQGEQTVKFLSFYVEYTYFFSNSIHRITAIHYSYKLYAL